MAACSSAGKRVSLAFQGGLCRFGQPWERWGTKPPPFSIDRKLAILRETYAMLNDEAQASRSETLEIAIVVLIVLETLMAWWRG